MKKIIIISIICVLLIFSYNFTCNNVDAKSNNLKDSLKVEAIYPIKDNVIGAKVNYNYDNWNLYTSKVYGFETGKGHYNLGINYFIKDNLSFDLKYTDWLENKLPDYNMKEGINLDFSYEKSWKEKLYLSLFSGKVTKLEKDKKVRTDYLNLNYNRELYYDWPNKLLFDVDSNFGQIKDTGQIFYSTKVKLPYKRDRLLIVPSFGYLNNGKGIDLSYNLENIIKGYSLNKKGNKFFNLKIEKSFDFLTKTDIPFLELFDIAPFLYTGDVWDEEIENFNLKSSAGIGLVLKTGNLNLRFDNIIDDRNKRCFIFNVEKSY